MTQFMKTLLDNIVFLILLLPIVGAVLVLAVSRIDRESVRRTALTNVTITFLLSLLMLGNFEKANQAIRKTTKYKNDASFQIRMDTTLHWLGPKTTQKSKEQKQVEPDTTPAIRLGVGVDGISVWLIFLTATLSFACVLLNWETQSTRPATFFALVLLTEAGLIGIFAALDIVLFFLFLELTLLPIFLLIGWWGGHQRRDVARKILLANLLGSSMVLLGLISIPLTYIWMRTTESNPHPSVELAIARLADGIRYLIERDETSAHLWNQVSPWIFLTIVLGFAIQVSFVPFHRWLTAANSQGPPVATVMLTSLFTAVGGYGLLRFVLIFFPAMCFNTSGFVSAFSIASTIILLLLALTEANLPKRMTYCCLAQLSLAVAGIFTLNTVGVTAGLLQILSLAPASAIFFLLIGLSSSNSNSAIEQTTEHSQRSSRAIPLLFGLTVCSFIGIPGLGAFPARIMLVLGIFRGNAANGLWASMFAFWTLIAIILLAWIMLISWRDIHQQSWTTRLTRTKLLAFVPLVIIIFWQGLWPQFFLDRIQPTISTILSEFHNF